MDITLAVATGFVYWEATHVFWKGYQCVLWEGEELETKSMWTKYLCDNGVSSFLRYNHSKHRSRRRHWRKINWEVSLSQYSFRGWLWLVRDNLEECIGFLISHWNVSNVLAKYATPSWESDDRSRCFVLYSMNSELSWSDSPELGCSHFSFSCTFRIHVPLCVWSYGRSTAKRRLFSCSFTGTKDENLMFLLLVCYRYHFTYRYTHGWDIPAVAQKIHKQNSGRIGL